MLDTGLVRRILTDDDARTFDLDGDEIGTASPFPQMNVPESGVARRVLTDAILRG